MSLSVIIPFYNAEDYLADAIRSVFSQTMQEWELILIDDGSTDRSLEIAKAVDDPRVRVFSDGKNKKLAARLNEGVELAKYPYIARMDADDLCSPNRFKKQLLLLEKDKSVDLVSSGVLSIDTKSRPFAVRLYPAIDVTYKDVCLGRHGIVHASIIGRRDWFRRNRYHEDYPLAEDYDLWIRSSRLQDLKVSQIEEPLYFYREEGNVALRKVIKAYISQLRVVKREFFIEGRPIFPFLGFFFILAKIFVVLLLSVFIDPREMVLLRRGGGKNKANLNVENDVFVDEIHAILSVSVPGLEGRDQ